ncbi:MAG: hypothetical protein C4581_09225 [Nitrospiraceae bacterium]|nr:MAG: hypothetical protein C4581_09225 [Nitrospiraceae bacterium]
MEVLKYFCLCPTSCLLASVGLPLIFLRIFPAAFIKINIMKFPRDSRELYRVFRNASDPELSELEGEYLVDMLTVWPSFKRFSHRKIFYRENNKLLGHNVLLNVSWGRFFIEEDICKDLDSIKVAVINYNRPENLFHIRPIRDHIRRVDNGMYYIGRFNYLVSGRLIFLGYFSLEKIK